MKLIRTLPAVILMTICTGAWAGSLPFSRPGMVDIPTASVLQHTQVCIGGSATAFSYDTADSTSESDFAIAGHLEVGILNRGQVGVTWLGDGGLSGNVRVLALMETITTPAIAVGCQNITGEKNYEFYRGPDDSLYTYEESQNFAAYIVLTKNLDYFSGIHLCLNLGYGIGRFRQGELAESDGISNPFRGLFAGFDYHPVPDLSILLEWDGRDANFGATYDFTENVRFQAGVGEFEQLLLGDRDGTDVMQHAKFSLGAEITLGPFFNRTTLRPFEELTETYDRDLLEKLEEIRSGAREKIRQLEEDIP